jgi:hypothetical protein
MTKAKAATLDDLLEEIQDIRKLLIVSVLRSGVKPAVVAKTLGYENERSLSNEFNVSKIRK